jgi:hypothetical protein
MNFIFDSCFFGTNNIYIQNNNTFIIPDRIPFNDVTQKMKNFFNIKKNQPSNTFSMNFNDNKDEENSFNFLKKKSHGDIMNNFKENEENEEPKEYTNNSTKYINNFYKKHNNGNFTSNNLDEDDEGSDKENLAYLSNNDDKNETFNINQILNNTIKEKKENDKIERERKKANKLKQMKMSLKNRKNALDNINKKNEEKNKENNCVNSYFDFNMCFGGIKKEKEINMMNID